MGEILNTISGFVASLGNLLLGGLAILLLAVGWVSLFLGRRFFWIFVGLVGFLLGVLLTRSLALSLPGWLLPLVPVGLGLVFAGLAVYFQRPMAIIAGFVMVGALAASLTGGVALPDWGRTVIFIAAGIIGSLLVFKAFDGMLILLSAVIGAALIASGLRRFLPMDAAGTLLTAALLAAAGIVYQLRDRRGSRGLRGQSAEEYQVTLPVTDVPRSVDFYVKTLGFELRGYWDAAEKKVIDVWRQPEPPEYAEVFRGPFRIGLRPAGEPIGGAGAELALRVSDLDDFYGRVQHSVRTVAPPAVQPWGERTFAVADPDGYRWNVIEAK